MSDEYFKSSQIFQRFRNGFRQYPFSFGSFVSVSPSTGEKVLGSGMIPDGLSIKGDVPQDATESAELSLNNHIDPQFIYDDSCLIGLVSAW
jgi:hypothetical protein